MKVLDGLADARHALSGLVGLVPTMGSFHDGHLALVSQARRECEAVMVSIFVNPLQFGPGEDYARYPRDLEGDCTLAEKAGADVVFAPGVEEMYPEPPVTRVHLEELTEHFEGAHRPGHFDGVAIVVAKLLGGLRPQRAYFGRKDAQQLAVVKRLVMDLSLPVEIVPVSTVRESNGLALSSRNRFLSHADRSLAASLSRGLFAAADAAERGERDASTLEGAAREVMAAVGLVEEVDYVALADAGTAQPLATLEGEAFLAVAAKVGETRLIDNVAFSVAGETVLADRGVTLEGTPVKET